MKANLPIVLLCMFAASTVWGIEPTASVALSVGANMGPLAEKKSSPHSSEPSADQVALQLVRQYLPELEPMLDRLRQSDAKQFKRATAELARWSRRLELAQKRDQRLYEIEVESLKAEAEVNLLTARLKVRDDAADRERLKTATARLQQTKLARGQYDVEMLTAKMKRAQQQLKTARERLQTMRSDVSDDPEAAYLGQLRKAGRQP